MDKQVNQKVAEFFSVYPLRIFPKGQILIHAGDRPQYIYYLEKGKVRQYDISYRGDEVVVNVFKQESFLPMSWAVTQIPNEYFFDAEVDTEARVAPYEEMIAFLNVNPDVMFELLRRVYIGVGGVLERMVHLMSGSAKSRLLYELIIECRRFGVKSKKGYPIKINESDLAARSGLARETVSREMQKFIGDNLISIGRDGILIKNFSELEKILGKEI